MTEGAPVEKISLCNISIRKPIKIPIIKVLGECRNPSAAPLRGSCRASARLRGLKQFPCQTTMTFNEYFLEALKANGIEEFAPLAEKFRIYGELLRSTNEKYNLTAITDDCGMAYKHFADCLLAVRYFPEGASVLDVGCGGGFPTLPLAIARPDLRITAMDSTAKKLGFIDEVCAALSLSGVTTVCARAEEAGHTDMRGSFDIVTARAVARLNILAEWCSPMVKTGGAFIALKGKDGAAELEEAKNAFSVLKLTGEGEEYFLQTPEGEQGRYVIIARKNGATPAVYPRNGGKIKKKPL